MDTILDSLNLINEILNSSDLNSDDVYCNTLLKLYTPFLHCKNKSAAMFFVENNECSLKCAFNNKKKIKSYKINNEVFEQLTKSKEKSILYKTKKDELLYENTLVVKLAVKDSIFGFILFSSECEIDKIKIAQLNAIASLISYKIKDYELNEVFKIQLKAMQDAVLEKEEAYSIIKKQHKKLQEADKSKNLFLANISHELRTPLNAIIGFSQALDGRIFGELNEKQSEYIKDIQISALHLLGMINEILDISKLEAHALKFTPANVNAHQAINEVITILEPLYKNKNIDVQFISEYNGEIFADYQKFQQILYNLLSNAIKFTNNNGKIIIKSRVSKNNYLLSISDNGIGIDKKYHNKIFKKFVHLNNVYIKNQNSTGLGLAITKELVKLHKGKITLTSELNYGTTFSMEFKNILI